MARRRDRAVVNPLLKEHVAAITKPPQPTPTASADVAVEQTVPRPQAPTGSAIRGATAVQIKARFSRSEADEIERFTRTLSSYLRSTVKGSEITRALWTLAVRSQDQLAEITSRAPRMERPSYGDRMGMAQYEDAIADFLLLALKRTPRG